MRTPAHPAGPAVGVLLYPDERHYSQILAVFEYLPRVVSGVCLQLYHALPSGMTCMAERQHAVPFCGSLDAIGHCTPRRGSFGTTVRRGDIGTCDLADFFIQRACAEVQRRSRRFPENRPPDGIELGRVPLQLDGHLERKDDPRIKARSLMNPRAFLPCGVSVASAGAIGGVGNKAEDVTLFLTVR